MAWTDEEWERRRRQRERAIRLKVRPGGLAKWLGWRVLRVFPQIDRPEFKLEMVWVVIEAVQGNQLVGRLVQEPVHAKYLSYGDRVLVSEVEIWAASHREGEQEYDDEVA
jgi:hypothetical protein